MRIAVFDYLVVPWNPLGGCHHALVAALCGEHEFVVFSTQFDNPSPDRIRWVRVPAPRRPQVLLSLMFHILAPILYWVFRLRTQIRFDLVQAAGTVLTFADIGYVHFCHRAFLKHHWSSLGVTGIRGWVQWLGHRVHAWVEPRFCRRVTRLVVPSQGLANELMSEYALDGDKIHVLANPVDLDRLHRPPGFDRDAQRHVAGLAADDTVLVFVALGHFERKGLSLILQAIARLMRQDLKLLVVGGMADVIQIWEKRVLELGLTSNVIFTGMTRDVRPYLWISDAFVFPSSYETFSLATFEAAAAALPLLTSRLHGVVDLLREGQNGFFVPRTVEGLARVLDEFLRLPLVERREMGRRAQQAVESFRIERFVERWRSLYRDASNHVA